MARRGGWTRKGSKGRFRYYDSRGNRIVDPAKVERIDGLRVPPAWRDVWISPHAHAKLQATGVDAAGRRQYLYHPEFRAQQERAKYDKLVRFAEKLPALRMAMGEHMMAEPLTRDWTCAVAVRLINLTWFRVGSDRYAKRSRTYGVTTLTKRHVRLRGDEAWFTFRGKHRTIVRRSVLDVEIADALRLLLAQPGSRVFRYRGEDDVLVNLTNAVLNDYIQRYLGDEFTAKDFRTWGGTLFAAELFARREQPRTAADARRNVASVMRAVAERLANTPAVTRASYVSPAVVERYLDGRTIDPEPRHHDPESPADIGLETSERELLRLLRGWKIRGSRAAA